MNCKNLFLIFLFMPLFAFAGCEITNPYYSGTLKSESATNTDKGFTNPNPTFNYIDYYGEYSALTEETADTFWTNMFYGFGLNDWFDITLFANYSVNFTSNVSTAGFNDTQVRLGFQICRDKKGTLQPDVRFTYRQYLPTGKYQRLNPAKEGTDSFGYGSYGIQPGIDIGKVVYWSKCHPMHFTLNFSYAYWPQTKVHGFHAYGGGYNTNGTVSLGSTYLLTLAYELSLTQKFEWMFDITYIYENAIIFSGINGTTATGSPASSSSLWYGNIGISTSFAYNFSPYLYINLGPWFSVWRIRSKAYISGVLTVSYTF